MVRFLSDNYLIIKSLHLIAMISWMAGLLYLPRLFVYHTGVEVGSQASQLFKIMEKRLARYIMLPAMILTMLMGGLLASIPGIIGTGYWFGFKILLVLLLCGFHGLLIKWMKAFEIDQRPHSAKFFKLVNEIPTLLMIGIIFFVVLKPL